MRSRWWLRTPAGQVAVAHNGNLVNADELRAQLVARGALFQGTSDTEVIVHLLAHQREGSIEEPDPQRAPMNDVRGAYSLLFSPRRASSPCATRLGFRPLGPGQG